MVLTKNVKAQNDGYMVELDLAKVVGLVNTATSGSGGIDGLTEPYADTISTVLNVVNSVVDLGIDADASVSEILNSIASNSKCWSTSALTAQRMRTKRPTLPIPSAAL